MTLLELAQQVKEANLSKEKLENYHSELTYLFTVMSDKLGDLEKDEAVFLSQSEEKTRAGAERIFDATENGLELKKLKRNLPAVSKLIKSVERRLYHFL